MEIQKVVHRYHTLVHDTTVSNPVDFDKEKFSVCKKKKKQQPNTPQRFHRFRKIWGEKGSLCRSLVYFRYSYGATKGQSKSTRTSTEYWTRKAQCRLLRPHPYKSARAVCVCVCVYVCVCVCVCVLVQRVLTQLLFNWVINKPNCFTGLTKSTHVFLWSLIAEWDVFPGGIFIVVIFTRKTSCHKTEQCTC